MIRPVKVLYVAPPLALTTPPSPKATAPLPPAQRSHKSPGVLASVLVCELSHVNKVDTVWVSSSLEVPEVTQQSLFLPFRRRRRRRPLSGHFLSVLLGKEPSPEARAALEILAP
jgi:hypothetical protein